MLFNFINPYSWVMRGRRALYRAGALRSFSVGVPVISVGNLSSGGTGKTPMVIYLSRKIQEEYHKRVAIILRGYKRNSTGLVVVSDGTNILASLNESGDEAQLLAGELHSVIVICDEDRVRGAHKAIELGAEVIILDDGFQHLRIKRDLNILLISEAEGIPAVIPFGKGREAIAAVSDADLVVITNSESGNFADQMNNTISKPIIRSRTEIASFKEISPNQRVSGPDSFRSVSALAVSGIGNPEGFEQSVRSYFQNITAMRFRDHTEYVDDDISKIIATAKKNNCDVIVTTTKDEVKLLLLLSNRASDSIPFIVAASQIVISSGEDILSRSIEHLFNKTI